MAEQVLSYGVYIIAMVKNEALMACLKGTCGMQPHIKVYVEEMEARRSGVTEDDNDANSDSELGGEGGAVLTALRSKVSVSQGGGLRFLDADGHEKQSAEERYRAAVKASQVDAARRRAHSGVHFSGGVKHGVRNTFEKDDSSSHLVVTTEGEVEMVTNSSGGGGSDVVDDGLANDSYERPEYVNDAARDAALAGVSIEAPPEHFKLKAIKTANEDSVDGDENEESVTVRLLVSEVVRLRDTVQEMQARLEPLANQATRDYRPYRKSDIPAGAEGAPTRT